MSETMKAVVVEAPMRFGVKEVPAPECPEAGLLLKVHACGLCGSDLRTLRSGHRKVTLPWIIGHEISGTVVEAGPAYRGEWQPGEMLAVAPLVFCRRCEFCVAGRPELCDDYREIAQAWPGGLAEYIAIPGEAIEAGTIQRVPEGLDPAIAAVAEPISSCVLAQERGDVGLGDTVVVIGAGPAGCIHIELARVRGAEGIVAADVNEDRLKLVEDYEPDHIVNAAATDLVDAVKRLTNDRGADVVITANPAPDAQVQAVEMAKKGGRILLYGGLPKDDSRPGIDMNVVHYKALTLIGATIFAPRHFRQAMRLLATGRIDGERFVTHRFLLAEFERGAQLALEGKVRKAVFLP